MQTNLSSKAFIGYILISASNSSNYISNLLYSDHYASYGYGSPNTYLFRDNTVRGGINTWYHMKWELTNGVLTYILSDKDGNILSTKTVNLPSAYHNENVYPSIIRYSSAGQTIRFRNVLVKAL